MRGCAGLLTSSQAQTASILSELLGKPIQTAFVPYEQQPFVMQHMGLPELTAKAWVEMNKGIDSRLIKFSGKHETVHGKTTARVPPLSRASKFMEGAARPADL